MLECVKPDYIFHLAAQSSVGKSFKTPLETYQANFYGTYFMLEAARKLKKLKGFMFVSSSDIYGVVKPKELPLTEDHVLSRFHPTAFPKPRPICSVISIIEISICRLCGCGLLTTADPVRATAL